ncbi:MAG: hypothetical protein IJI67_03540 [Clostridia bacterium]|nr:hypothetical protein [Clostridia bacterium]
MLDFFDTLQLSAMLALHEYFGEKEKQKKAKADFDQQCFEAVADAATKMSETISNSILSAYQNRNSIPNCLAEGMLDLPIYAMLRIAKKQRWVSEKQSRLLDLFFKNLEVKYTKQDFLLAINGGGSLESRLEKSVGLNEPLGEFWRQFFSIMRAMQNKKDIFGELIDEYAELVMNFSCLNANAASVSETEIKAFISALSSQYEKSFTQNQGFDIVGEHDWRYYKNKITNLSHNLIIRSGDAGVFDMTQLLDLLFKSILFGYIRETNQALEIQRTDYCYICEYTEVTEDRQTAGIIFDSNIQNDEVGASALNFPVSFIRMLNILGTKANDEDKAEEVVRCITNFMFSVENTLIQRNHYANYDGLTNTYMSDILENVLKEQ